MKVVRVTVAYDRKKTKELTDLLLALRSVHKVTDHAYDCMYKCGDLDIAYDIFDYRFTHEELVREKNDVNHPSKFDVFMEKLTSLLFAQKSVIWNVNQL